MTVNIGRVESSKSIAQAQTITWQALDVLRLGEQDELDPSLIRSMDGYTAHLRVTQLHRGASDSKRCIIGIHQATQIQIGVYSSLDQSKTQ
jgi:hypothetical protein